MESIFSTKALEITQFNVNSYLVKMKPIDLITHTTVAVYNPEESGKIGYQRPLNLQHAKAIADYLLQENNPIILSSILCAINSEDISFDSELSQVTIKDKVRIVDGQHRVEGLKIINNHFSDKFTELNENEYAITIIEIKPGQEIYEIETFVDINSKSKKVSTDLAIELRKTIRNKRSQEISVELNENDFIEEILSTVANVLNDDKNTVWYTAIKGSKGNDDGIITINAFINSLKGLMKKYLKMVDLQYTVEEAHSISNQLKEIITDLWNIIKTKWPNCFEDGYYTKLFNIQKGIGVNALHIIFLDCLLETNFDYSNALEIFKTEIFNSEVTEKDWRTSGPFGQYSSGAGYKELARILINE
ncbi:DGQHR domain-containing protein [Lysinibacillus sphaericus]|uniref:DGQHR domain-containing protein n=1 Tax=Lysinibacillus sphaericus TaxID=1421 RepID=UPI0025A30423|nr:DGQHR domain-containing protein [Lysinibacillus sphaericus]MDM5352386.1 DGQHR domain-containing protein [Lysinibacillus sphaericus]